MTKYSSYLDDLVSLVEQLTAINDPTIHQVNALIESVQSLHKRTSKLILYIFLFNVLNNTKILIICNFFQRQCMMIY